MATSAATLVEENSGARVLIVDDDEELCELMTLRLGSHGYGVSSVHTAEQAKNVASSGWTTSTLPPGPSTSAEPPTSYNFW